MKSFFLGGDIDAMDYRREVPSSKRIKTWHHEKESIAVCMYFIFQASWHEPQAMTPDLQREREKRKKKLINILIAKDKIQSIKKNLLSAGSNRTNFERDQNYH